MVSLDVIDTWILRRADLLSNEEASTVLDEADRARSARFRALPDRQDFARGRATMRMILAGYLGCPPARLTFGQGQYGKPFLRDAFLRDECALHFNWSHAQGLWLLVVTGACSVGVDVEAVRPSFDWRGPASVAFHPSEHLYVERCGGGRQFFELWTRKEAVFKGIGTGLHDDMARTSLVDGEMGLAGSVAMSDGNRWRLMSIALGPDHVGAVAACCSEATLRMRTFAPGSS